MTAHLLPLNATHAEQETSLATGARIEAVIIDPARPNSNADAIRPVWDPETASDIILAWLAWSLSVDFWDPDWPADRRRAITADSLQFHQRKGAVSTIPETLAMYGLGTCTAIERPCANGVWLADGSLVPNNTHLHRANGFWSAKGLRQANAINPWAMYSIRLGAACDNATAVLIRRAMGQVQPARCYLILMDFTAHCQTADGTYRADATYNAGVAHGLFARNATL